MLVSQQFCIWIHLLLECIYNFQINTPRLSGCVVPQGGERFPGCPTGSQAGPQFSPCTQRPYRVCWRHAFVFMPLQVIS